jgi:putative ABC transport system permease protein
MLNLYVDVQSKLRTEFRKFGANIVMQASTLLQEPQNGLSPSSTESFTSEDMGKITALLGNRGLAVPFAYTVARKNSDQPVVVAATDFEKARQLNPWWSVSAWPNHEGEALVGVRAAQSLGIGNGESFALNLEGKALMLKAAGTVQTGAGEDSRIYISLHDFHSATGLNPSVVEIAAYGPPEQVTAVLDQLRTTFPNAEVYPVRQITEGEANIVGKTRSTLLWSSACIVVIAALCVLATLMGWVFDRRRDFAIMKALGASDWLIALFVTGEAGLLGLTGAVLGFIAGVAIAASIGRLNFQAPVTPQFTLLPVIAGGALLVTLISTLLPLRLLRAIQPAMILRGE